MDDVSALIHDAAARAAGYLASADQRPVTPSAADLDALQSLEVPLPPHPTDPSSVIDLLDTIGSPATEVTTGGSYFGFVNGGALPVTMAAHILATAWDQNVALPVMSPIGATVDRVAAQWVIELLDLPAGAVASFCSGASVANLICLIAARDAVLHEHGWDTQALGLIGAPPVDVVIGDETHLSVVKALGAAGLGRDSAKRVATDPFGRMSPAGVAAAVTDRPTIVVTQAGNVNSGYSDPFRQIAEAADGRAWIHVDGAFGLWAAASPARRHLVDGVELADSW